MLAVPWSLEISGLYQNFEVSCTNFTALLPKSGGKIKCLMFLDHNKNISRVQWKELIGELLRLPAPGDGTLTPLRGSGVRGEEKGRLLLLLLLL